MNRGKIAGELTMANLRLNPPQPVEAAAGAAPRSRHAAITHDLYSYRRYRHWMNSIKASWDKT